MISFDEFAEKYEHLPPRELLRMLYQLSCSWERVAMVGLDKHARARVAREVRDGG